MIHARTLLWVLFGAPLALSACATATRTANTDFIINTIPAGASVTTDLQIAKTVGNSPLYYGCAPTPCVINLPRRSDFNILVSRKRYQPFTYAITKERNKEAAKKNTNANVIAGASGATAYVVGGSAFASPSLFSLVPATVPISAAAIMAVPVIGIASGIDLASGAMIDLYPNPLNIVFTPEETPEQTAELIQAFHRSRQANNKQN